MIFGWCRALLLAGVPIFFMLREVCSAAAGTSPASSWRTALTSPVAIYHQDRTRNLSRPKIYVEADGELVGTLPAKITVVPDALTLLAPAR